MEKNRGVIRELLKYEFELGHTAKEAMDNINRAKGHGIVAKGQLMSGSQSLKTTRWRLLTKNELGVLEKSTELLSSTPSKRIRR